jgi:tetratricopeptide (TPR) repeat protein
MALSFLLAVWLGVAWGTPAGAPTSPAPPQESLHSCGAIGWVPPEILNRPVALRPGIGRVHETVTTSSPEAQAFYDQGLAYLHSFVWIEAARSFHQALRLDPNLAMAYVGLSRVYVSMSDDAAAMEAARKAQELAPHASDRERRIIALRFKHLDAVADLDDAAKHQAYKKAIDDALAQDIEDPELWILRGIAEEPTAGGRGQSGTAASVAFYRQALAVVPDHFAAHHYLVHSYETLGLIDKALVHGEAYARLAPAIPHARHMYGHDLRRVGRVEEAIAEFRKAYELESAYYAAEGIPAELDWHHAHNLDLLATAYQHQGQRRLAEQFMRLSAPLSGVTQGLEYNKKEWAAFLLGSGRKEEALVAARELGDGRWPATRAASHVLAGHALLALGRSAEVPAELAEAEREALAVAPASQGRYVPLSAVEPWISGLKGEMLLRQGRAAEAREILKEVEARVRSVPGPDAWTGALFRLEAIARLARELGDWELAEHTGRQMLAHDAAYGGSHYALAKVAEHRGDTAEAQREFAAALSFWRNADADLPELVEIRTKLPSAAASAAAPSR